MTDELWFNYLWYSTIVLCSLCFVSVLIPILRSRLRGRLFCLIPLVGFAFGWIHVRSLDVRRRMITWTAGFVALLVLISLILSDVETVGRID